MKKLIVGLTTGCFDLIHYGHLHYLKRCKELCDHLYVGIDSDKLVKKTKGADRPIINEEERFGLIANLACVDSVFYLNEIEELSKKVPFYMVNKVFKHDGWRHYGKHIYGVDDTDAELVIVPDIPGLVSTTEIISRIRNGK